MTLVVETLRYGRADELLWHDTGRHVLVLPTGTEGQVSVLGGGSAALWRLLERPRSVRELMAHFTVDGAEPLDMAELVDCLYHLAARGVLDARPEPS